MSIILEDPAKVRPMTDAAQAHVAAQYSLEGVARRVQELLTRVAGSKIDD
jgi:hypothetical protein